MIFSALFSGKLGHISRLSSRVWRSRASLKRVQPLFLCTCMLVMPAAGDAAISAKDIQVAGRILGFTTTPLTGNVRMGIAYDPANALSAADEQTLLGILGSGLPIGDITLIAVPITIEKLARTPADILFLTAGPEAEAAKVGAQVRGAKILCITTDLRANQAGNCAVSVQTAPTVQITINKAATAASGIAFESAFMMMITEI